MPKFTERGPNFIEDSDPERTEYYKKLIRQDQERAQETADKFQISIIATKGIIDNESIIAKLNDSDKTKIEKIKSIWQVEVVGNTRAYRNSHTRTGRLYQSMDLLNQAQQILTPAIQQIILEKAKTYGIETPDIYDEEKTPKSLYRLAIMFPKKVLNGIKHFEDMDKELEAVIEEITKPK